MRQYFWFQSVISLESVPSLLFLYRCLNSGTHHYSPGLVSELLQQFLGPLAAKYSAHSSFPTTLPERSFDNIKHVAPLLKIINSPVFRIIFKLLNLEYKVLIFRFLFMNLASSHWYYLLLKSKSQKTFFKCHF